MLWTGKTQWVVPTCKVWYSTTFTVPEKITVLILDMPEHSAGQKHLLSPLNIHESHKAYVASYNGQNL